MAVPRKHKHNNNAEIRKLWKAIERIMEKILENQIVLEGDLSFIASKRLRSM